MLRFGNAVCLLYFRRSSTLTRLFRSPISAKIVPKFRMAAAARILVEAEGSNRPACKVETASGAAALSFAMASSKLFFRRR